MLIAPHFAAAVTYSLGAVQVLALGCVAIALGTWLKKKFRLLDRLCIPTPLVGGFVFALAALALHDRIINFQLDTVLRDLLMIAFMTTIGLNARLELIRRGGIPVLLMLALASVGAVLQNLLGIGLAKAMGLNPLIGILSGSVALTGGPGTALAFGPTFEKMGVTGAAEVGAASAIFGITVAGLLSGYIGSRLIRRNKLHVGPATQNQNITTETRRHGGYAEKSFGESKTKSNIKTSDTEERQESTESPGGIRPQATHGTPGQAGYSRKKNQEQEDNHGGTETRRLHGETLFGEQQKQQQEQKPRSQDGESRTTGLQMKAEELESTESPGGIRPQATHGTPGQAGYSREKNQKQEDNHGGTETRRLHGETLFGEQQRQKPPSQDGESRTTGLQAKGEELESTESPGGIRPQVTHGTPGQAGYSRKKNQEQIPRLLARNDKSSITTRDGEEKPENNASLLTAVLLIGVAMGVGSLISGGFERIGMVLPPYIGAMIVAAFIRNVNDRFSFFPISQASVNSCALMALYLFIAMAVLTLRLWELAHLVLPMFVILAVQVVLCWLMSATACFYLMGRNYEAAVMSSGFCGFMLGITANAVASMEELVEKFGPAPKSFLVVPVVGAFLIDFMNSLIIKVMGNWVK